MTTFYKVVDVHFNNGVLLSGFATCSKVCVTYVPGQYVTAKHEAAKRGYHLLVFDDAETAHMFRGGLYQAVYTCECEDEVVPMPPRLVGSYQVCGARTVSSEPWPEHTRMFKRVKLLERVG